MEAAATRELVRFLIGGRRYALPAEVVREVIPMVEPTPMPSWPERALGLLELRGELFPLVDLSDVLGLPPLAVSTSQYILVVVAPERLWGVVVDAVESVSSAPVVLPKELTASPFLDTAALSLGVVPDETGAWVVLAPAKLFDALDVPAHSESVVAPRAG